MKAVVNRMVQTQPEMKDREAFEVIYRKHHPQGPDLTAEDVRTGFDLYKKQVRKIKRVLKQQPGTVGPDRIRR